MTSAIVIGLKIYDDFVVFVIFNNMLIFNCFLAETVLATGKFTVDHSAFLFIFKLLS